MWLKVKTCWIQECVTWLPLGRWESGKHQDNLRGRNFKISEQCLTFSRRVTESHSENQHINMNNLRCWRSIHSVCCDCLCQEEQQEIRQCCFQNKSITLPLCDTSLTSQWVCTHTTAAFNTSRYFEFLELLYQELNGSWGHLSSAFPLKAVGVLL